MVIGIIIGFVMASSLFLATTAIQIKKQGYEQKMQDQQQKHVVEKMVFADRIEAQNQQHLIQIEELEKQISELSKAEDAESLYLNGKGFYTHKKITISEDEDK